jgi:hypothetical protein
MRGEPALQPTNMPERRGRCFGSRGFEYQIVPWSAPLPDEDEAEPLGLAMLLVAIRSGLVRPQERK